MRVRRRGRGYGGAGLARSSGENECPRCGDDIEDWGDACKVNGRWIHKTCHGGADDG
ncbi:hypothetical protein NSI01_50170 [Pimelobacter simplex]|nr:hypothetical protein NSI01_50170 [Pimelobacter simplex]